jgi:hypothetical protein
MKKRIVPVLVAGLLAFTAVGASPARADRAVQTANVISQLRQAAQEVGVRSREVEEGGPQAG